MGNEVNSQVLPPLMAQFFDKISLGVLYLELEPRKISYFNPYFRKMSRKKGSIIVESLFQDLEHYGQKRTSRCDIEIEPDFVVGYSIYKLSAKEFFIFLNDISHKKIYFENQGENRFYDKLSGLLAEVVHEIGNPLAALNTTLQVLYEYLPHWGVEKKKKYVTRAIDEIDRLSGYLDRMRRFSRIDVYIQQAAELDSIVQRVIDHNSDMIAKKNLSITCVIPQEQMVVVDEDLFHQVLFNLFLNSIDILPPKGKISIHVQDTNEFFVKLVYRNNGPPIPEGIREKIFIPFFSTKKNGSGIGLAVSLKLMTRMGGALKVLPPTQEWGANFVLYIPVNSDHVAASKMG